MRHEEIAARLQEFEEICRQKGLPVTMQRRVILEAVLQRDDHPTADQIYEAVQERIPQLSRTTVYRVLDTLLEMGVIRRVHLTGGTSRFDGMIRRHHHLVCTRCGKIIDIDDEQPRPTAAAEAEVARVRGGGLLCSDSRESAPTARRNGSNSDAQSLDRGLSLAAGVPMHLNDRRTKR